MSLSVPDGQRRGLECRRAAVMLATVTLAGSAVAADNAADKAADSDNTGLQEVVVTAQFRAQSLQDKPVAIPAGKGAMMEERGKSSLRDLAQQAPNVSLVETGG